MLEGMHIYQFDVKIAVGGLGTTSYCTAQKTVIAANEKEAREKLYKELTLTPIMLDMKHVDPNMP